MKYCFHIIVLTFSALLTTSVQAEMRALWVATVVNIDWPSSPGLSAAQQKAEFDSLLDDAEASGINTLIVQVRAAGDAIYPSKFAPWSRTLSGVEGQSMRYDPLDYMIKASHRRNIALHAWINPYRAAMNLDQSSQAADHDINKNPDWMIQYGNKVYYDPGRPEVRLRVLNIIAELLARYAIDGVHFDDYFYPYRIAGEEFNDQASFLKYAKNGQSIGDWRRENTARFIYDVKRLIQTRRPKTLFGVSPFGVWRNQSIDPSGSQSAASQTSYDDLYADVRQWAANGWVDYLAPQLYWEIGKKNVDYRILLDWWNANRGQAALVIGLAAYKAADAKTAAWRTDQLFQQIDYGRERQVAGFAVFSAKTLKHKPVFEQLNRAFVGQ